MTHHQENRPRTKTTIQYNDLELCNVDHVSSNAKFARFGAMLCIFHRIAVVVQDLATQWLQSNPCKTKTSQETQKSLMKFLEPTRKPKIIYTDNSLEFWNHCTSTPHRSETHGIAERTVRRVKEGTSAVLLQSGLDNEWADSTECCCYHRNIQDLLSDGKTPYERRFGKPFNGPIILFGAMVEYHPISAKNFSRLHQFGSEALPGKFLGYVLYADGIWIGDIMVADIEELEEMDASELHARRLNAKEVSTPMKGETFIFPVAEGTVKTPGGGRRLKPSTLIRDRPERREEQEVLGGESDGLSSQPLFKMTQHAMMRRLKMIAGLSREIFFFEPRVKLYVPKAESFLIPLKYIEV